jgi:hypothetical protein
MNIRERMTTAEEHYAEEISKIAQAVREELLIPYCDKHKMNFDSGMGTWSLENDMIYIYGYREDYWDLKETYTADMNDDEYDAALSKAKELRYLPETIDLINALAAVTLPRVDVGCEIESYKHGPKASCDCACKGLGLIPPTAELPKGGRQVYCPRHRIKRT